MNNKIIRLYREIIIKPLELRRNELLSDCYTNNFDRVKKEELVLVTELLNKKLAYLLKLSEEVFNEGNLQK